MSAGGVPAIIDATSKAARTRVRLIIFDRRTY
jgi:hypothetical protein